MLAASVRFWKTARTMNIDVTTELEAMAAETRRLQAEAARIHAEASRLGAENTRLLTEQLRRSLEFDRRYPWVPSRSSCWRCSPAR
jgi:hypothetical protein